MDVVVTHSNHPFGWVIIKMTIILYFRRFQRIEGASSFVTLG